MTLASEKLRNKLVPGGKQSAEPSDAVISALEGYVESGETLEYKLPGKGGLVHEQNDETEKIPKPADGQSLAIATDRKVLFVVASPTEQTVIDIDYPSIKTVDANDGLLRSKLSVAIWGEGEYRFKIADSENLGAAVHYLQTANECWQRVLSTVDDAADQIPEMAEQFESGNTEAAKNTRDAIGEKLDRSRQYLDTIGIEAPEPLCERIDEIAMERDRTAIRVRFGLAKTFMAEATHLTDSQAYTDAYQRYQNAREHLEATLSVAREAGASEPAAIHSKLETIDNRLHHLEVRPLALARQARERAQGTDKLDVEVEARQEAFEHYRDALTAGWGTDLQFQGDTEDLKFQTEIVLANLIEGRKQLAKRYEDAGDQLRADGSGAAIDEYERAITELEQAEELTAQFRAGNSDEIDQLLDRVETKRHELRKRT